MNPTGVAELLAQGADPIAREPEDQTFLENLSSIVHPRRVFWTDTALLMALKSGVGTGNSPNTITIVRLLLGKGADTNRITPSRVTPLMEAAVAADSDAVNFLITAHAHVNATTNGGQTALMYAVNSATTIALLAAHADAKAKDRDGTTALILARSAGSVKALIAAGADVNARGNSGSTPLNGSAYRGDTESIRALLASGAKVNTPDNNGQTPLITAVTRGKAPAAKTLIDARADTNVLDGHGHTALFYAKLTKRADLVRLLQQAGAKQ